MADYWKSQAKHYCAMCNSYMADNKVTREKHEQGRRHQENVEKKLKEIRTQSIQDEREKKLMDDCMQKMNEAAKQAMTSTDVAGPVIKEESDSCDSQTAAVVPAVKKNSGYKRGDSDIAAAAAADAAAAAAAAAAAEAAFNPLDWKESKTADGRVYYWNVRTKETSWDKPAPKLSAQPAAPPVKSTKMRLLGKAAAAAAPAPAPAANNQPQQQQQQQQTPAQPNPPVQGPSWPTMTAQGPNRPSNRMQGPHRPPAPVHGPIRPPAPVHGPNRPPAALAQRPSRPITEQNSGQASGSTQLYSEQQPITEQQQQQQDVKQPIIKQEQDIKQPITEQEQDIKQPITEQEQDIKQPITEQEQDIKQPITEQEQDIKQPITELEQDIKQPIAEQEQQESEQPISSGLGEWTPVEKSDTQPTAAAAAAAAGAPRQKRRPKFNFEERTLDSGSLKRPGESPNNREAACTFKKVRQSTGAGFTRISGE